MILYIGWNAYISQRKCCYGLSPMLPTCVRTSHLIFAKRLLLCIPLNFSRDCRTLSCAALCNRWKLVSPLSLLPAFSCWRERHRTSFCNCPPPHRTDSTSCVAHIRFPPVYPGPLYPHSATSVPLLMGCCGYTGGWRMWGGCYLLAPSFSELYTVSNRY